MNIEKPFLQRKLGTKGTDEWYTPSCAVEIIVPFLEAKGYHKILCPFDKEESNFVKVLQKHGFDVSYSHIDTGMDFFLIDNFYDYDAVISNPPYSKRQQILERLYEYNIPFAMIMNYNGLFDNRKRFELFRDKGVELLVPCGRIAFFNDEHKAKAPMFQSIYVCNKILQNQIEFAEMWNKQLSMISLLGDIE